MVWDVLCKVRKRIPNETGPQFASRSNFEGDLPFLTFAESSRSSSTPVYRDSWCQSTIFWLHSTNFFFEYFHLAFRAVQNDLQLEEVYVLGTNCADNSPSPEAAENFIREGVKIDPNTNIRGYEFMQDFKVHVKGDDSYVKKPYFTLPGTIAKTSIATSCLACFDYVNGLADVVVGYMGAPLNSRMDTSLQTITVRNERGREMVQTAIDSSRLQLVEPATGSGSHEKLASATVAADSIVLEMTGGKVPEQGMPLWIAEIIAYAMTAIGPKVSLQRWFFLLTYDRYLSQNH